MNKLLFPVVLLAIVGCATSSVPTETWDASRKEVVDSQSKGSRLFAQVVMSPYGVWIGKGPKILASDGRPLRNAKVVFGNDPSAEGLPIDEDGSVIVNRYVSRSARRYGDVAGNVTVSCPGYHSELNRFLVDGQGPVQEIRLRPILVQPPCRSFSSEATLASGKGNGRCSFDLVEGDWLPPYGWGKVEDLRVTVSTNLSSALASYSISFSSVKRVMTRDNQQVVRFEFVRDGDGFGKDEEGFSDCTNRVVYCKQYDRDVRGVFKVRGHYGSLDSSEIRKESRSYYVEEGAGKSVRRDGPEVCRIKLNGRVNTVAELKGLESATVSVSPQPPVSHPAPKDVNSMAFGVAENGRAAVFFGWTKDGVVVPEIFRKGVYSTDPATDLPDLETLYLDTCFSFSGMSPMVNGLKNLRTVVLTEGSHVRNLGGRALADNPKLDAVLFDSYRSDVEVAADTFAGSAEGLTAVFAESSFNCNRPWDSVTVSNVFSRMVKVYSASGSDERMLAPPEVDLARGEIELPVVTLEDGCLNKEYSDGRILRYRKDGFTEKVFK